MKQISAQDLAAWLADAGREKPLLLDVREPWEFERARIAGAHLIPMREIPVSQVSRMRSSERARRMRSQSSMWGWQEAS